MQSRGKSKQRSAKVSSIDRASLMPTKRARVETGVPRLDRILEGGLVAGSCYVIVGPPGSGKTTLCNQIAFAQVAGKRGPVVYMTLLVESHTKMLENLSTLEFFRPEYVPDEIVYVSGYQPMRTDGLEGLSKVIRETLRARKPALLVIDGLDAVAALAATPQGYREFLHTLQAFVSLSGATLLMTSHYVDLARRPEFVIADGLIELSDRIEGTRAIRELVVHKFRGSGSLRGAHRFEIDGRGLVVHPRIEAEFDVRTPMRRGSPRTTQFGIAGLDAMLPGGVSSGAATAFVGAPGTGKTLLGLAYLVEGARRGERGMYVGFGEHPARLIETAHALNLPLKRFVDSGLIDLVWQPSADGILEAFAEQMFEALRSGEHRRLVIDGIEGLRALAGGPDRIASFVAALTHRLRASDVAMVVTEEIASVAMAGEIQNPWLARFVENVILTRHVEVRSQRYRFVSVMKTRAGASDAAMREFTIGRGGIEVSPSSESAEAILSGRAKRRVEGFGGGSRAKRR